MKKIIMIFIISIFMCQFCACGKSDKDNKSLQNASDGQKPGVYSEVTQGGQTEQGITNLKFLCTPESDSACSTQNGYYYLTSDALELKDKNYGTHLMYMDFATCREICLCSTAGCRHDSADCPAVFLYDEFPVYSTKLFVFKDNLYILSRKYDNDGSMSINSMANWDVNTVEGEAAVLYRAGLDGTNRQKIYTFDSNQTLEDLVLGDENGIYVITKKLSADKTGNTSYITSSERKLMYLDIKSCRLQEVCPMTFDDNISWQIIGCSNKSLILSGTDFGKKLSKEEQFNDDAYRLLYENSDDVYAVLNLQDKKPKEIYRTKNSNSNSSQLIGDTLYISSSDSQNIDSLNITNGEKKTLCTLSQNLIMGSIGDILCCRTWNLSQDFTYYFVNVNTGEVRHSSLVNKCNGWSLEFRAECGGDVLVIYDYDAKKNGDESYSIYQYKYALISKEDLLAGRGNYRKIEMIGAGK